MEKIIIVGGGASGIVSAIYASKQNNEVTILEKNNICGKKILVTGNGRCNYWNEEQSNTHYRSQNREFLDKILTEKNKQEILNFFNEIGIVPKIKNGYYYPFSNQAISMQKALINKVLKNNIKIEYNFEVEEIIKKEEKFEVISKDGKKMYADKVIVATGSKAASKTGSDGTGYLICKKLGHTIIKPLPALVQLKSEGSFLKDWNGVRADVSIKYFEDSEFIAEEKGEIQLTDYGISGICVFNLSGRIARGLDEGKKEKVEINFIDSLQINEIKTALEFFEKRNKILGKTKMTDFFEGLLNTKITNIILKKLKISQNITWDELNQDRKTELMKNLIGFKLNITGTNSFDKAQVCSGGIPLNEIRPETMESTKTNGLHIVGELLDADGDCGGYNLEWAWITAMIAGKNI